MKVAVCVSGIPRHKRCNNFLQRIGSWYETVVFVNYWEHDPNIVNHQYKGGLNGKFPVHFHPTSFRSSLYEYHYTSQSFEKMIPYFTQLHSQILPHAQDRHDIGVFGMFYSILKSHEMRKEYEKKNNMKFDVVVRARFESGFRNEEGINSILDLYAFDLRCLWIPDVNINAEAGMNDQVAFSNGENMDIYMTAFNRIVPLSNRFKHSPEWIAHYNTEAIKRHCQTIIA